jgi:hypothetical protein
MMNNAEFDGRRGSCALLVPSCDAYSDLWAPFLNLFESLWPDCPFSVFLGSNQLDAGRRVTTLKSDAGPVWSDQLIDYLHQLPHEYVLLMLEDFFLRKRVSTDQVLRCLEFVDGRGAHMLRLIPRPRPNRRIPGDKLFGICDVGPPYRICMQAAIWRRTSLLALLEPGETIWQFEIAGTERSGRYPEGFFAVSKPVIPYSGLFVHHVVEKGRWFPHQAWLFGRRGIGCDFSRRGSLSWQYTGFYHLVASANWILDRLPLGAHQSIKRRIRRVARRALGPLAHRLRGF